MLHISSDLYEESGAGRHIVRSGWHSVRKGLAQNDRGSAGALFFTIYKIGKSFISIQKFECIIITLCVKTWGILAKEKNNYVFSCIEYLQSMKPCVEPIKKKKKLDCF